MDEMKNTFPSDADRGVSRRNFIKGVICGGAAVSSAGYLFRASNIFAQSGGSGDRLLTINVNGQPRRVDAMSPARPPEGVPFGHTAADRRRGA